MACRIVACLLLLLLAGCATPPPAQPNAMTPQAQPTEGATPDGSPVTVPTPGDLAAQATHPPIQLYATDQVIGRSSDAACPNAIVTYALSELDPGPVDLPFGVADCGITFVHVAALPYRFSGDATFKATVVCPKGAVSAQAQMWASLSVGSETLDQAGNRTHLANCPTGSQKEFGFPVATQAWRISPGDSIVLAVGGLWHGSEPDALVHVHFEGPVLVGAQPSGEGAARNTRRSLDGEVSSVRIATTTMGVANGPPNGWVFVLQDAASFSGGTLNVTFAPRSAAQLAVRVAWGRQDGTDAGFIVREDVTTPGGLFAIPQFEVPEQSLVIVTVQPRSVAGLAIAQPIHMDLELAYQYPAELSPAKTTIAFSEEL